MRIAGGAKIASGRVTMKVAKQEGGPRPGRWVTIGGKKVKIEPPEGEPVGGEVYEEPKDSNEEFREIVESIEDWYSQMGADGVAEGEERLRFADFGAKYTSSVDTTGMTQVWEHPEVTEHNTQAGDLGQRFCTLYARSEGKQIGPSTYQAPGYRLKVGRVGNTHAYDITTMHPPLTDAPGLGPRIDPRPPQLAMVRGGKLDLVKQGEGKWVTIGGKKVKIKPPTGRSKARPVKTATLGMYRLTLYHDPEAKAGVDKWFVSQDYLGGKGRVKFQGSEQEARDYFEEFLTRGLETPREQMTFDEEPTEQED